MGGGDSARSSSHSLHPLVLVNITDHFTRTSLAGLPERVTGVLFGFQHGLSMHVTDSFEVPCRYDESGSARLDADFIKKKQEHFGAVFPQLEMLGWYAIGADVRSEDLLIHRAIAELNESPLFLLVDSEIDGDAKDLPVKMFETVTQVVNDVPTTIFVDAEFQIEATEPERITVDTIVKGNNSQGSTLVQHLRDLQNSVQMLLKRVRGLENFLLAVKSGEVEASHSLLRQISAVCHALPLVDSPAFQTEYLQELDDSALVGYLTTMTKGAQALLEVEKKLQLSNSTSRRNV